MNGRFQRRSLFCALLLVVTLLPLAARAEPAILPVQGQSPRIWQDDSGYHQVRGTLIGIGPREVRLLKENQRVTTVPLDRLSLADRAYVGSIQVVRKPILPADAGATEPVAEAPRHVVAAVTLSRDFLNRFLRDVDRKQELTTTILGVPIRGWAHTTATTELRLIPDSRQAVLEIPIRGQVTSQTVGAASVARIHSESVTDFEKSVRINLTATGVSVEPQELSTVNRFINSSVSTSARYLSGLVARIANRRVQASKPAADRIARQQERERIDRALETVAEEKVSKLNRVLGEFLSQHADSSLVRDSKVGFSTTESTLQVALATQTPPASLPPPPEVEESPLVVQLHASVFLQAMESGAGEMTQRLQQLAAGESAALQAIRREMESGKFASSWSEDETWLTITWQPDRAIADAR